MDSSASRRSGWVALCVSALARMLLGVLASLLLWAVVPAAFGLTPTVVMTGSMMPRLVPGDVVVSRPVAPSALSLQQTLLFPDPDQPGHLRMHRWVDVAADGRLVTKGDANPERDSTTIAKSDVLGVATLRIPFVARPILWAGEGRYLPIAVTGLGLALTVAAAFWFRAADRQQPDGPGPGAGTRTRVPEPGAHRAVPAPRTSRAATGVALVAVLGLGTGLAVAFAPPAAAAPFGRAVANPTNKWSAATYFSCAGAARGAGARFAWPLGETSGTVANDVTTNGLDGTYAGGYTRGVAGPCATDRTTAVTLNGTTGTVSVNAAATNLPELTLQVWFKTSSTRGGTLFSMTDINLVTSMAVAMTTTGTLTAAVNAVTVRRVTSTASFRDNAWHLATVTLGANGLNLYVDGVSVGATTAVTSASGVTGTPRVGYGDSSDLGVGSYDYFTGTVAWASLFKDEIPAAGVLSQYRAAA